MVDEDFDRQYAEQEPEILGNSDDQNPQPSMHSTDVSMVHRPLIAAVNYRIKTTCYPPESMDNP